ncbi:MAG: ATP-binding protein [Gemmatimonadales bacterium]|jgi:signal transduction histidine kinase|nr:ATP-binding protein [Gemmatimonadales bacterium]
MTRWTVVALLLVCAALAAVGVGAVMRSNRDRAELMARFAAERLGQVQATARRVEEDLGDIGADLRFASQFAQSATSAAERSRELGALLAVVRPYRLLAVYDGSGTRTLLVRDPLAEDTPEPAIFDPPMQAAAMRAATARPGELVMSPPIPGDATGWYRVFAVPLSRTAPEGPRGAIALLVHTQSFFDKLHLVATEPTSPLLLLSATGGPTPATAPELARAVADLDAGRGTAPDFADLVAKMRAGETGSMHIPGDEARALGLPPSGYRAAFAPIRLRTGRYWSVATLTSTSALRTHERAALLRLAATSGAIIVCLLAFGAYVVVATRRSAGLRERLLQADRLSHLHEKTEKILDNVPAGVMALAEDGQITAVNRFLRDRIPAAAVGSKLNAAFPEAPVATVARLESLLEGARSQGRVQSLLGGTMALFGEEGRYSIHAVPLEPRFPEARFLLVIEDLTEVRSLESQLLRAEKLATVGVLAAGIAHEIGTPLGVVRGRAEYVLDKLGAAHAQAGGLQEIVDQIDHVSRTIVQLLDFARVKPAAVQPVAVGPLATAIADLLRLEASRRKVSITVDVPDDLTPVAADPDQLQQVLVNLVMNACDACSPNGRVGITARAEESGPAAGWGRVRIDVTDDGCGIPPEHSSQVFDPFFTTKKRGQGTGLGLSIAAQIVRNHGGEIALDSEPGRGTCMSVLWPAAAASNEEHHDVAS